MMEQFQFSLVFFTVLSQWGIGCIAALTFYRMFFSLHASQLTAIKPAVLGIWGIILTGSLCSLAHLGSPFEAYYALRGLGSSWLSFEVVAFGTINGVVALWVMTHFVESKRSLQQPLGILASVLGLSGVVMSGQIYFSVEHQPEWNTVLTHLSFIGTALLLGMASLTTYIRLSNQSVPTMVCNVYAAAIALVLIIVAMWSQIAGLETNGELIWYRVVASIIGGVILMMLITRNESRYNKILFASTLIMVTGEIAGRMSFYSSVLSKTPW
ncbi:dimethyl sulfoxide reductase anchor subunit family protein [Vibrio sp. MACH09]|uniref:dimethyl sulfoxide reductase anchor subunit family protein n=1 Tax=Vibrio sp. MACH09 TaxID=3025122 RepID=UPI00295ECBA2|nr:DmsC/YnfH family molybdoenzyme membrane anchor subunit [Vibrio sp. MACH09]